jgi:tryptophan synthase alpha chain
MGSTLKSTSSKDLRTPEQALQKVFTRCREEGRAALVLYTTAGFPEPGVALDVLRMLADAGADVIELGVPFSDPLADGPTIQHSSQVAIEHQVDLEWTLDLLARFRAERDTPVVVFTYLNPILRYGVDRFLRDAAGAGANGVLVTDLPVGADPELEQAFAASPLALIRQIAPTTPPTRAREIAAAARGFLYYISRTGVTGASEALAGDLAREVSEICAVSEVPVAVGFGISTPEQAATVARLADGVVVGSALINALSQGGAEGARELVSGLRGAVEHRAPAPR